MSLFKSFSIRTFIVLSLVAAYSTVTFSDEDEADEDMKEGKDEADEDMKEEVSTEATHLQERFQKLANIIK